MCKGPVSEGSLENTENSKTVSVAGVSLWEEEAG